MEKTENIKVLKPCPFCGTKAKIKEEDIGYRAETNRFYTIKPLRVECEKGHFVAYPYHPELIDLRLLRKIWNTRY